MWVGSRVPTRDGEISHPLGQVRVIDAEKGHLMEAMAFGRKSQLLANYSPTERGPGSL